MNSLVLEKICLVAEQHKNSWNITGTL